MFYFWLVSGLNLTSWTSTHEGRWVIFVASFEVGFG
jgi:hypothetical protein